MLRGAGGVVGFHCFLIEAHGAGLIGSNDGEMLLENSLFIVHAQPLSGLRTP